MNHVLKAIRHAEKTRYAESDDAAYAWIEKQFRRAGLKLVHYDTYIEVMGVHDTGWQRIPATVRLTKTLSSGTLDQ